MTFDEIRLLLKDSLLFIIVIGCIIIEIINVSKGKTPFSILLIREFRKIIDTVLSELNSDNWMYKLNALLCIMYFAFILIALFCFIKAIFVDHTQAFVFLSLTIIFSILLYWIFKFSIIFISSRSGPPRRSLISIIESDLIEIDHSPYL